MADVPFTGNIDEARIYNRALSVSEVTQLYRLTAPTSTDTGLEGYWSFNGKDVSGTTAFDRSGAGNTGTLTGGPSIAEGKLAQGLNFDGSDDYVSVADAAALTQSALTVSFWKKNTNAASNSRFVTKSSSANRSWSVESSDAGRNIQFITSSTISVESENGITPNGGMAVGQWYHVVCVFNGAGSTNAERMQIYINGAAQSITFSGTIPAALVDNSHAVNIGGKQNTAGFPGAMDEVRIYNRALSAGEAKGLYDVGADDKTNSSVSQPQGTGRLDSGLAGYWKLDEGSGTSATDSSTSGNTGTIANGTWATGRVGGAVSFSSASATSIKVGDPSSGVLDFGAGDFTISACALSTGYVAQTSSYNVIISKNDTSGGNWGLAIDSNNKVYFHCAGFVGAPGSTTAINDGQWHHILGTRVAGVATLYVDGALQTGTQSCSGNVSNVFNFKIGDSDFTGRKFNGSIDEVRLYNRALSADEVAQLYRLNAPSGTDTSLKGYWSFNGKDMSGTTAYDRSGMGNTGTLIGPVITEGKIGQGLLFDGVDDQVAVSNTTTTYQYADTTFTVTGWFKKTDSSSGYPVVQGGCFGGWGVQIASGTVQAIIRAGGSCGSEAAQRFSSTTTLNDGKWHHFAVVMTTNISVSASNDISIYVDGALNQGSIGRSGSPYGVTAANLVFGVSSFAGGYFSGSLDEVRVYNRALTAAEIASLSNSSRQTYLEASLLSRVKSNISIYVCQKNTICCGGVLSCLQQRD